MANYETIAMLVSQLSAAYPNWNVNEFTTEVYYQDLRDLPDDELMIAAQHCRAENGRKFAPSTGEIRGAVVDLRRMSANVPTSYQAWQEVQQQILENGGDFGNPVWSSPLVEKAVRLIGWRNLRMSEEPVSDRARFIQCYEQLFERATKAEMLIPEVRGYLELNGAELPTITHGIKQLADKWSKK